MKPIELLARQVDQWWRIYVTETPSARKRVTQRSHPPRWASILPGAFVQTDAMTAQLNRTRNKRLNYKAHPSVLVAIAVVSLTSTIGYRFYNAPKLDVGTIAPETLFAPDDARVEDTKSTEERRKQERTGAVPVLMLNQVVNQEIYRELYNLLSRGTQLRLSAGPFPYLEPTTLSTEIQHYLRACEEWEWRIIRLSVLRETPQRPLAFSRGNEPTRNGSSANALAGVNSSEQQRAIAQLRRLKQSAGPVEFANLLQNIEQARFAYQNAMANLERQVAPNSRKLYKVTLFELTDAEWEATQQGIKDTTARILAQGVPRGLPLNILRNAISLQVNGSVPLKAEPVAIEVLSSTLKPNLTEDAEQTRLRAEQAAREVDPVIIQIAKNEVIVEAGQSISQADFVLIDYFGLSERGINWTGLIGFAGLVGSAVCIFWLVERRVHSGMRRRDYLLVLLLTLSAPTLVSLGVSSTSLPAIGLLIGSFYGSAIGVTVVGLLSLALPIGLEITISDGLASAAGGLLGGLVAGRLRSREEVALLGVGVGLIQGAVYLLIAMISSSAVGLVLPTVLGAAALRSLSGIAWSIVALGLSPYLEHVFDLLTPVRLAELANPNRPLLQRLALEAPGTFQHTLFVSTLAEAAARELNCNVELVRAGTLYHDIGKMHNPLLFCENQMGGPNKHDTEIKDPWKSAEIIKKHVSEGLVMARKYRLPKAIQAFIPEHQGTMLIAFFYHQAQQMAQDDPSITVRESDFRYDGPVPQSRETGILMLADSCEAALRSLKEATYEEALAMVNKILRARWQDNQLIDSGLTREEMNTIADVFVRVWQQFHHKRVAYPKTALTAK
ncbi:MAG: HDIG domain-containing protein [Desertifilum sp. SIO1I2]|nr:HDIG domain-containing protein [Desertifilum sp. SIO1I2]